MMDMNFRRKFFWLAGISLAAFILISADVLCHGLLQQMDMPTARWIAAHRPWSHPEGPYSQSILLAGAACLFGNLWAILGISIPIGIALLVHHHWRLFLFAAVLLVGTIPLNKIAKTSFALPRPTLETSVMAMPTGYTYPSGHTMGAIALATALGTICTSLWPRHTRRIWLSFMWIPILTGLGLLYIGVHYITDILGAAALSLTWYFLLRGLWRTHKTTVSIRKNLNCE